MTKESLLFDLYTAYYKARRHKSNKGYVKYFERNLKHNIETLCDELWNRTYKPERSTCFIITDPKKREIFAAAFRDRIVHHFLYDHTHELFEKTFIYDTYSCIEGRGTHFGIDRLDHHIRSESENYTKDCYVLKLDIRGYFMAIHRPTLLSIAMRSLKEHGCEDDLIYWLTEQTILLNPTKDCNILSSHEEYEGLSPTKTLFKSKEDCGLPIGNLTSQLFSNVYLNEFDQYMKRVLKCKHYGRYVDDAYVVSKDKDFLLDVKEKACAFLKDKLLLNLHQGKSHIVNVKNGVEFLGAYLLPHRRYVSNQSLMRMKNAKFRSLQHKRDSSISRYGILNHYKSYNVRKELFNEDRI